MPRSPLHFHITLADPRAHRLRLRLRLETPDPAGQVLRFASWTRGSYLIRDFARHITWLRARCRNQQLAVERLDKRSLRIAPCRGPLTLDYEIHAFDPSVRKAWLDTQRGFANGTSLYFRPDAYDGPVDVTLLPPPVDDWHAATTLTPLEVDRRGFGDYRAADWEEAVDHPIAFGPMKRVRFAAEGIDHELVFTGLIDRPMDEARLREDLTRICEAQRRLFDNEPALARYQFLTAITADGYGGLEHRSSSALVCSGDDLPLPGEAERSARYRNFLGLCSHEYFHLWNVKRITPQAFAGSDLGAEAYTRDLWAYEGVTSYYDDLMVLRAGCMRRAQYLEQLAETISRVRRTPGRALHSLADASFEAWTKFYQPDENLPNATVSYYAKGALVALLLDLRLRRDGNSSLDAVMRRLWQRYGRDGRAAPEGALEAEAAAVSGLPLRADFDAWLRGTAELPLEAALADFGIGLQTESDPRGLEREAFLGLRLQPGSTRLAGVVEDSPAQEAGLGGGDTLVAVDQLQLEAPNLERRLGQLRAGRSARIHFFREQQLMEAVLTPQPPRPDRCRLELLADVDADTAARRDAWLGDAP